MDFVGHGIPFEVEPAIAPVDVAPAFTVSPFRVLPHEHVIGPLGIIQGIRFQRPLDMRFPAANKFAFVSGTAPWAGYQKHGNLNGIRLRRHARL